METENKVREIVLYFGDQRVGTISKIESLSAVELQNESAPVKRQPDYTFTAYAWKSCRSRKRFIKLMMGVFSFSRNRATWFANEAMLYGCPAYQELWADCYTFFVKEALGHITRHRTTDNLTRGSE